MPDEKPPIRLFGLTLDFKVNVIALVAFLLSTSSLVLQGIQILRGVQVTMSTGDRVNLIRRTHPAAPEAPYLIVNARLDYVNIGAVGRDAIISSEHLAIEFSDLGTYEYRWFHFELFVPDESGSPKENTSDVAHSFPVPGAGAATHQTTFVPFSDAVVRTPGAKAAHVLWDDFLRSVKTRSPIVLRFFAADRRGGKYETGCTIAITDPVLDALRQTHWATVLCEENPPQARPSTETPGEPPAATQPATQPPPGLR